MLTLLPTWSNLTELPSEVSWTADGSWTMVRSPWIQVLSFIICNKAFACGKLMSMMTVQEHTQMPFGTVSLGIRPFPTSKVSLFSILTFKDHFLHLAIFAAPLFIFQWQVDLFQLYADNIAIPSNVEQKDQWNDIRSIGKSLRTTFESGSFGLSTIFSPACIAHNVIAKSEWTQVEVDGVSLPDALACWSSSLPDAGVSIGSNLQTSNIAGQGDYQLIGQDHRHRSALSSNEVFADNANHRQR